MQRCSGCDFVRYCSEYCQHRRWQTHKSVCRAMAMDRDGFSYQNTRLGENIRYGPMTAYDFELIRHIANTAGGVEMFDMQNFSELHGLHNA